MRKLKISELAKLFNISRQTLLYYDNIDLLKPAEIDKDNAYRYYSLEQARDLSFIILLKEAGLSLNDIKKYTLSKNIDEGKKFLINKEKELDKKIKMLKKAKKRIHDRIEIIDKFKSEEEDLPKIETIDDMYLLKINLEKYDREYGAEVAYLETGVIAEKNNLDDFYVFSSLNLDSVLKDNYIDFTTLGIVVFHKIKNAEKINSNLYATLIHSGSFYDIHVTYKKLLNFIKENSYHITGNPIEISDKSDIFFGDSIGSIIKVAFPIKL